MTVSDDSPAVGKRIMELGPPDSALVMLVEREDHLIAPRGAVASGDTLNVFTEQECPALLKAASGLALMLRVRAARKPRQYGIPLVLQVLVDADS